MHLPPTSKHPPLSSKKKPPPLLFNPPFFCFGGEGGHRPASLNDIPLQRNAPPSTSKGPLPYRAGLHLGQCPADVISKYFLQLTVYISSSKYIQMSNFKFVKIYAARKVFTSWSSFVTSEVHRCFAHSTWVAGTLRCQGMGDSLERARWRLGKIPAKSRTIRHDTSLFVDLWQLSFGTAQDLQLFLKNLKVALRWVGMCIHPLGCAKVWTTDKASLKLCPGGHARRVEVSWKHMISVHLSAGAHSQRCQLVLISPFKSDLLNLFLAGNHDLRRTPAPPHLPLRDGRFCSDSFMHLPGEWYLTLLDCIDHIWLCYTGFILFDIHWYPFQRWFNLSLFQNPLRQRGPFSGDYLDDAKHGFGKFTWPNMNVRRPSDIR